MDDDQFDTIARLVLSQRSRRSTIATALRAALLAGIVAPFLPANGTRATRGRARRRADGRARHGKRHGTPVQTEAACYPGSPCIPGPGKNTSRCDFGFSTVFRNRNARGSNLSKSNFAGADLRGADFRGANLSGGCFVGADLTGARLGSSVNLRQAVFCRTTMPDGRIDDSGCEGGTPCCHRLLQDCPDANILCFERATPPGICGDCVGMFGPVGRCYQFPAFCCPCEHNDLDYWQNLCNQTFPERCNGQCVAQDDANFTCWDTCSGGPPQSGNCSAPIPPPDR